MNRLGWRLQALEAARTAGPCRACYGRIIAIRYDPPPEGPALLWGVPLPPVECPVCGKAPGLVVRVRTPESDAGGVSAGAGRAVTP